MIKTTPDCQSPRRRGIGTNYKYHQHSVFREAGNQYVHGIDFKPRPSESCEQGTQSIPQRIVAPAPLPGGYSVGVPPDPIPNSAVKPACANGTIAQAMEE